ncbi:MAG: site-specific integrase [Clostridia bacterium]|nr:site-specific integrase [Clostridia bacterium]
MAKRRPNGEGMIRQKKKGQWEGRIVVGHKTDGKPIYRYVYAKTQKELIEKLHQKIELYRDANLNENSNMTLGEWLDKWLNSYMVGTIGDSTLKGYRNLVETYIKPNLGDKQIAFITTADVQKMYNKLKKQGRVNKHPQYGYELSDSMVIDIHRVLHKAMKTAVQEHLIPSNPTEKTVRPKTVKKEKKVLTNEQLNRFINEVELEIEWRDFFYTELTTGLRRGEICGLKWSDFDEENGRININRSIEVKNGIVIEGGTKTCNSKRSFYLPESTVNILTERKSNAKTEWIFTDPIKPNLPIAPPKAYRKMKELLVRANLPDIRFHDLRHTFATQAITNGVDAKTLSGILGHTKASFTLDRYTHVTIDMQKRAANIIGNFITDIFGGEIYNG